MIPFIEIIESITPDPTLLMWKFEDEDKEIKNGAKLTVRESQQVLFLNEGQVADTFGPGHYSLSTQNIPVLSRIKGWKYGFESPFKSDIYFFNTHQFINQRWGTPAPILMSDSEFGQVRVRAFGVYNLRIMNVATFFRQYAGTYGRLTIRELEIQLRDFIAPKFGEILVQHGYSIKDVAGNITTLSDRIQPELQPFFEELGLELTKFQISSVTLPEEVTKYFDTVTNMNMIGDMSRYQQFAAANALGQAGTAMNTGLQQAAMAGAMAGQYGNMIQSMQNPQSTASGEDELTVKLKKLKSLFDNGLISEDEYNTKKKQLLDNI